MNKRFTNLTKGFAVVCLLVLTCCVFVAKSYAQTVQNFKESQTWTVPAGVYGVEIQCWGAGGNGGSVSYEHTGAGGGGGGGYAKRIVSVTPGQQLVITVGMPAAVVASSSPAEGGTSSVSSGSVTYLEAFGGKSVAINNTNGANGGGYNAPNGSGAYGQKGYNGNNSSNNPCSGAGGNVAERLILAALGEDGYTGEYAMGICGFANENGKNAKFLYKKNIKKKNKN